jgi:hypothetical protein
MDKELLIVSILLGVVGITIITLLLWWYLRHRANRNRMFSMVFLKVMMPKKEAKEDRERESESGKKDFKEAIGVMSQFYDAVYSLYDTDFKYIIEGQDFLSFEYALIDGQTTFFIVCPRDLVTLIDKQLTGSFPDAYIEEVPDYNIFKPNSRVATTYLSMDSKPFLPVRTHERMNSDPLNTITNAFSKFSTDESGSIQIVIRPRGDNWQKKGQKYAEEIFEKSSSTIKWWNPVSWLGGLFRLVVHGADEAGSQNFDQSKGMTRTTPLTDEQVKAIEEKNTKFGFDAIVRLITVARSKKRAKSLLSTVISSFTQYATTNNNAFGRTKYHSDSKLIRNYILRNLKRSMPQILKSRMILSPDELASMWHVPDIRYNPVPSINWQKFKIGPAPENLPDEGLLLGHNIYRGEKKEIRIKREDRFRHFYVIGQTGTGKSSILQTMIRQDFRNGDGICVVDPHGSLIEDILPFIPRERADDVIYFNPADMERPMGLNLLEAKTPEEMDMVALDAMNIMIKLFDEETFGPRIQDYFRNGCLTLMEDPEGGALTDIVRLFTDDDFQKLKVSYVKNPVVKSFWTHQMAKTGAREKGEMIPYFAAKFGQFVTNTMMRNIIGQTKSAFDFGDVMQSGKILLMNLSKGETGDINSKLLGLIVVAKLQMAAMRRQRIAKEDRKDFFLYIDEFQNYVTDSIESILSEARKYRLGLNIAHQYLAQIEDGGGGKKGSKAVNLKDAIFGNVGSIMCYKIGAQDAEFMAKEMSPVFSDQDLINIDKYKGVMKLSIDTQPSRPFSIIPLSPYEEKGDPDAAEIFKQLSRLKYGRDKEFVSREIIRRIGANI